MLRFSLFGNFETEEINDGRQVGRECFWTILLRYNQNGKFSP